LAEDKQLSFMFTEENTERVERLRKTKLFVIIGNPPYNAWQLNENDNNKNRKYKTMGRRVADTYAKDGTSTLKNALADPYVKAIRWASDKILDNGEGVVAFVTNNGFVNNIAFDGMRKHLADEFSFIYILDLAGNVRKNPKISGTTHNVFGIQVGVSINLLVKLKNVPGAARILYSSVDEFWRKEQKFSLLESAEMYSRIDWRVIGPSANNTWLTEGYRKDFEEYISLGAKKAAGHGLFTTYSSGVCSNNDAYVYNSRNENASQTAEKMVEAYNLEVGRLKETGQKKIPTDFLKIDESCLKWIRQTKRSLLRGTHVVFASDCIRTAIYRPFCKQFFYFDRVFNEDLYRMPRIFPTLQCELQNVVICVTDKGSEKPFMAIASNHLVDFHVVGAGSRTQCFPFYTYDEEGANRRENITDWAVEQFSSALGTKVDKWQIFHYVYGLLHSPEYREKYKANLKRELPRIPMPKSIEQFQAFASAGERLADLHVNYESQQEYPLERVESPGKPLNWRVQKMKLTKDKTAIVYNEFLTLSGIPPEAFEYRLGNRSALDWIIDRYQVHTDKRSGIVNDPNRPDGQEHIVRLIGKIITVSLETVRIVKSLPSYSILLPKS